MHRGWKGVIGTLSTIHIIIGMNWLLRSHLTTRHFNRAVRDDLIGIHIGLRPRTRLEHDQRKVRVEFSCDHFICSAHDQIDFLLRQFPKFAIRLSRTFLEDSQGTDNCSGETKAINSDREVVARTLGLCSPVTISSDLDHAHAIGFGPYLLLTHRNAPFSALWPNSITYECELSRP